MTKKDDGHPAQGEALPKIRLAGLFESVQQGTNLSADTLSKWQHGWRIKPPQAMTEQGQFALISPISGTLPEVYLFFGGMGREPKKTPPLRRSFVPALLCGYPIRLVPRTRTFFHDFYLPDRTQRLPFGRSSSYPHRIRTISAVAHTEAEARAALAGLPLVFMSRDPGGAKV